MIHMVEGENQLLQDYPLVSAWDELTHAHMHTCTYAYTRAHTLITIIVMEFFDAVVRISVPKDPTSYKRLNPSG